MDPQPTLTPKRTSPRILWIPFLFSLIIFISLLLGLGIFIGQKLASNKAAFSPTPTQIPFPTPTIDSESTTYHISGNFTQSVTSQNTEDFNQKVQILEVVPLILEMFPPRFNISGMTQEKCTQVKTTLTTLPYLTKISPCAEDVELPNPEQDVSNSVSSPNQTDSRFPTQ